MILELPERPPRLFQPSAHSERNLGYLARLARHYRAQTSTYDRAVCTGGRARDGTFLPATAEEQEAMTVHAAAVFDAVCLLAKEHGFTRRQMLEAIRGQPKQLHLGDD